MRVLDHLNVVPVAKTRMSEDGRVLVVDRFDVDARGAVTHGVEDACGLLGLGLSWLHFSTWLVTFRFGLEILPWGEF